jgi:hypothetical protein
VTDIKALAQRCFEAGKWDRVRWDDLVHASRAGWQAAATVAYTQGVADERARCLAILRAADSPGYVIRPIEESGEP